MFERCLTSELQTDIWEPLIEKIQTHTINTMCCTLKMYQYQYTHIVTFKYLITSFNLIKIEGIHQF